MSAPAQITIAVASHEAKAVNQLLTVLREPKAPGRFTALVILINGANMSISRADPRGLIKIETD